MTRGLLHLPEDYLLSNEGIQAGIIEHERYDERAISNNPWTLEQRRTLGAR